MDIETFRAFCLSKKEATEACPFGPDTLVFKVCNKVFALCSISDFKSINLKCEPEKAIALRANYEQVKPGFHMNKKHWNTVHLEGLNTLFIQEMINDSYTEVVKVLPKTIQKTLFAG